MNSLPVYQLPVTSCLKSADYWIRFRDGRYLNWKLGTGKLVNYLRLLIVSCLLLAFTSHVSAQLLLGHEFVGKWRRTDGGYQLVVAVLEKLKGMGVVA